MNLIAVVIGIFTTILITPRTILAIQVPTAWPKLEKHEQKQFLHQNRNQIRPPIIIRPDSSEISLNKQNHHHHRPYVAIIPQAYNKINTRSRPSQPVHKQRHPNPKKREQTLNDWTPIVPKYQIYKQNDLPVQKLANLKQKPFSSIRRTTYKNYRDDKTHEEEPVRESFEFPTRPIYPGEGQWAKKGIKHQLYIPIHRFGKVHQEEEETIKPEGIEIFEKNEKNLFDKNAEQVFEPAKKHFKQKLPLNHKPEADSSEEVAQEEEEEEPDEENEGNESAEFIPMQLYTQVRRSENEEHLPASAAEDERLKEIVKDSKIQTVYTEEGYEDAAYDHAGHEKLAEEDEGFAEFDKDVDKHNGNNSGEENNEDDTASAGSEYKKLNKPSLSSSPKNNNKKVNKNDKNNFIKTEETKTTAVKDAGGGNSEMEISSQIKILATPNNSSKTHKYVKIFPKIYRYDKIQPFEIPSEKEDQGETFSKENSFETNETPDKPEAPNKKTNVKRRKYKENNIEPQEDVTTFPEVETSTPSIVAHIPELEFPADIEETSSENENLVDSLQHVELARIQEITTESATNQPEQNSESGSITSTSTVTQPKPLKNSQELVDEIAPLETISSITKAFYKIDHKRFKRNNAEDDMNVKYPYYSNTKINPDSPLRYSEALETIPQKNHDDMAFYNQANRIECPEVETEIDPIPDYVKNGEETDESSEKIVKGPRLGNLGDKIECFKMKYFGENPLDSPIFTEVTVSPVVPVLNFGTTPKSDPKINEIQNEEKEKEVEKEKNKIRTKIKNETTTTKPEETTSMTLPKSENKTESSITIITTPKYTIDLQPKHIYDQIELLHYLPAPSTLLQNASVPHQKSNRTGKSVEQAVEATTVNESTSPESAALRKRRRRIRPNYAFEMNQFMSPPPPPSRGAQFPLYPFTTTTTPKENLISEVQYKNEIKPIEQLNVFSDIINNIKNSTKESLLLASASSAAIAPSDRIAVKLNTFGNNNNNYPYNLHKKTIHMKNSEVSALDNIEETNSFYLSTTTTTIRPIAYKGNQIRNKFQTHRDNYEDLINEQQFDSIELLKVNAKPGQSTSTSRYEKENEETDEETNSEVLGMMPPGLDHYKTIYSPQITAKPFIPSQEANKPVLYEKKMNNFYYIGMKPPSSKQKIILYSDFKTSINPKRKFITRRSKRSAQRPVYSSVVRNRNKPIDVQDDEEEVKPIVVTEEDDDYVPHRPKNYHYDEKTGRIVYDKKEEQNPKEAEEEIVYIEVTDAPVPKPTRRTNQKNTNQGSQAVPPPKFNEATGPSFVDFIKKLKSNPKYEAIPDPTTTEKSEDITTSTTTLKPVSTTPPEFLGILAKVRSNANYKQIEDEKSTTTLPTTTTEAVLEEIEETQVENVQNAPGGQSIGQNFQIFDISEYLPKVKNYSPRTSIDYSKYKTIERPNLRHNLSSRYNSEEEDLENVRTSRVPILLKDEEMSESKVEEIVPDTTTTQAPSTTTLRRIRTRTRVRSTRRPAITSTSLSITATSGEKQEEDEVARHEKPKRTYPRRRPGRIRISSKIPEEKPKESEEDSTSEAPEKVVKRRQISSKIIQKRMDSVPVDEIPKNSSTNRIDPRRRIIKKRTNSDEAQPNNVNRRNIPRIIKRRREDSTLKPSEPTASSRINPRRIDQVEVFNKNIDQNKKHGGNYKEEIEEKAKNKAPATVNQSETKHVKQIQRLTDIVPKPDKFYTDQKLPENINKLKDVTVKEDEEEEIDESGPVHDEVLDYDENVEEELDEEYPQGKIDETSTKKPFFVKDPSKRLYYYAPV